MTERPSPEFILQSALDCTTNQERAAYLDEVCGNDAPLRKEIDSLLAAHFAANTFMDTLHDPVWQEAMSGKVEDETIPTIEELASDFPELEIIELIGKGGMGAVFKAKQASLDRLVALKVLPSNWNLSGNFQERFEREAKILAGLNHPGIVTIHEFGERNGRYFFTMEFVDGTDLERMIQSGELAPDLALNLIPQLCDAIQFAHNQGVVHRDIKPGNILVDRAGRVKVADFGIAKLGTTQETEQDSDAPIEEKGNLTAPQGVVGTPRYMAPEQAAASTEVDHRADLYALGVVFYEMLVGAPPSKGAFTLPSSRNENVDRRWDRVVMRALAEDPDRRYQNASEIRTAVESVLAEQGRLIPRWAKAATLVALATAAFLLWPRPNADESGPLINSLKMQFVPVPGVEGLVSVWETRVKDYEVFLKETEKPAQSPPFEQTGDHPVVHVSWHEARAFCQWLTAREHKSGKLPVGEVYRLPTDREWSAMAHLPLEEGVTPQERHRAQGSIYSWGEEAPIPDGAGNFPDRSGQKFMNSATVAGYQDGFAATAPVGSFTPTADGLYDLGGNAWEWTATPYSPDDGRPALRGGGWWADEADDRWQSLLASHRRADVEATTADEWDVGFRLVRGPESQEVEGEDLFRLILKDDKEGVVKALTEDLDVNDPNRAGQPPIVLAADSGNLEMTQLLHEHGAKLEASDRRGRTPLHAAAQIGNTALVTWLLENGAKPRARTTLGQEPLLLAIPNAPIALLEKLLAAAGPKTLIQKDAFDYSPFSQACIAGSDETVRWIIAQISPDQIQKAPSFERNAWMMSLASRDNALMADFLKKSPDSWSPESLKPIMVAAVNFDHEANFNLLSELVGQEGLNQKEMTAIAMQGAARGRPWAIKTMQATGWSPKNTDRNDGENFLHIAMTASDHFRNGILEHLNKNPEGKMRNAMKKLWSINEAKMPPPSTRETIRLLAEAGCDLEARDKSKRTPLIAAAMKGNLEAVETLLALRANTEAKDDLEFTPLLSAVEKGHLEIVKELDRHGADFSVQNKYEQGVLHNVHNHVEVLRYLLTKKLPIEAKCSSGETPLAMLAREGYEEGISILIKAGANIHSLSGSGENAGNSPLHLACQVQPKNAQKDLDTQAALGGPKLGLTPWAGDEERTRSIKILLAAGADPMAKNKRWLTPLHIAASSGLTEAVELFLESGTDPNAPSKALNGPLHHAAMNGHLECCRLLIAHGAVLDSPVWQIPLLTSALDGQNPAILALFLEHKAPLDKRDPYGAYPLHRAAFYGQTKMAKMLLDAGAEIDARDFSYETPLHIAAAKNQREVVNLLWKQGARMNAADQAAHTPAQAAARSGHTALSVHLEELSRKPISSPDSK